MSGVAAEWDDRLARLKRLAESAGPETATEQESR